MNVSSMQQWHHVLLICRHHAVLNKFMYTIYWRFCVLYTGNYIFEDVSLGHCSLILAVNTIASFINYFQRYSRKQP